MKIIARILGGSALVIIVLLVFLFFFHPRIPLGALSGPASSMLTLLSGSEQVITGKYFLVPGKWTTFSIEGGSWILTDRQGFRLQADITSAQTSVHLWSLVKREINLDGITARGITLDVTTGSPGEHKEVVKTDTAGFFPFTLKQTGDMDLGDMTAAIVATETDLPITFHLVKGTGAFSQNAPGRLSVEAFLGDREFRAALRTGPLAGLSAPDTVWPYVLEMNHKSVSAAISGSVAGVAEEKLVNAEISLTGEHFDDLVSILGYRGSKDQLFALQGTTILSREEIRSDFSRVQLGSEILALSASVKDYTSQQPQYIIALQNDHLNLDNVKVFFTPRKEVDEKAAIKAGTTGITRDDIIFPGTFPIRNLIFDLHLKELVMADKRAKDLRLNAVMVDGVIDESPFAVTFKNSTLSGHFSFRIDEGSPHLSIQYNSSSFDIGTFLADLQLADGIVMHVENTSTALKTKGRTLGELFDNFEFTVTAGTGKYEYQDPNTGAILPVSLDNTKIIGVPGEKITATAHGKIGDSPVSIIVEIDDRRDEPPSSVEDVSAILNIRIADAQWNLTGKIPLPFTKEGIDLHSKLSGERLSSLNELLHLQLPDIGPYELTGEFIIVPEGYRLDGIQISVGSSLLNGAVVVDTKTAKPEVKIGLAAQRIQLNDFKTMQLKSPKNGGSEHEAAKAGNDKTKEKQRFLTDQAVVDQYNALVEIEVKEVLSGTDFLGSGSLKIEQRQGRFQVKPLEIWLPEGTVNVDFSVSPSGSDRFYTLHMLIADLDYGLLGRWFVPDTDMSGIVNLRASLESVSPDRENIMANGSGYIDFSIQPRRLRAGVIDLWAVNLFSYLVPFLAPKEESKINCAAGRFNLMDGLLSQDEFLIDTSKIRVKGIVEIDFNKGVIDATLRPIPKRPQFYSLSTPIKIHGSLSDLDARIATGGVIGTVIRLATTYIAVPLQWIVQNKLPEDGTLDCLKLVEERSLDK